MELHMDKANGENELTCIHLAHNDVVSFFWVQFHHLKTEQD